jgi:zinc transporter ZupT
LEWLDLRHVGTIGIVRPETVVRVGGWHGCEPVRSVVCNVEAEETVLDPTLTVLLYSSVAALTAAFGVLPLVSGRRPPKAWMGWANALAGGLMLGVAYALLVAGLEVEAVRVGAGALMGVAVVWGSHALIGTADLDLNQLDDVRPEYGYQVIVVNSLHAAHEGVAIGIAMAVSLPFGILMALSLAVHNIPEATVMSAVVTRRGVSLRSAAVLAVATNALQVLLAVVTFSIALAAPAFLPWALGFAVGALIYLVLVELLPESYREAGHTSIALVTIAAMGVVVLLRARAG